MKAKTLLAIIVVSLLMTGLAGCQVPSQQVPSQVGEVVETPQDRLSKIKVAVVYEALVDRFSYDGVRDVDAAADLFSELGADFIHRAFFRWRAFADFEQRADIYGMLEDAIERVKAKNPDVIIGGAVAAQEMNAAEYNPFTGEVIPREKVWEMALDPQRYGLDMSKEELHKQYWDKTGNESYIFPDILNPDFQALFLDIIKKQIDAGVDAIWIDGLLAQAGLFARVAGDVSHPSVAKVIDGASKIVDAIHEYGETKGKRVYVGSWSYEGVSEGGHPYALPKLDFVTVSPSAEEVRNKRLNEDEWKARITLIREKYGDIPIIAFIDWAFTTETPMGVFSQTLSPEEAREALRKFDRFFRENGIIFAYPVHGGNMGAGATRLSFGEYGKYDSLAPEFDTYGTIKELALEKK